MGRRPTTAGVAIPAIQRGPEGVFGAEVGDDGGGVCDGEAGADDEEG